jgi:hypothetical protein
MHGNCRSSLSFDEARNRLKAGTLAKLETRPFAPWRLPLRALQALVRQIKRGVWGDPGPANELEARGVPLRWFICRGGDLPPLRWSLRLHHGLF